METSSTYNPNPKAKAVTILLVLVLGILLLVQGYAGYKIFELSEQRERLKTDYSVANNITFGVFSVDQWREKIVGIVESKLNNYKLKADQKKELQRKVELQLNELITTTVKEFNKPQKTLGGKLKKLAFNVMVDPDEIRKEVPVFAKTIMDKLNSPASMRRLKYIANSKIDELERVTYDNTEPASATVNRHIYSKYKVKDAEHFDREIRSRLDQLNKSTNNFLIMMCSALVLALGVWWLSRKNIDLYKPAFLIALLSALVLLITGCTTTLIELDARMENLSFVLLDQKLSFDNQVLFFQTKSIWGIVVDLLQQSKLDAVLVGVLIFLFVLVTPVVRLIGRGVHVCNNKSENKFINFLASDLGKWDMSDVMIVGVAMTYIGLNGILKSQLSNIDIKEELLTTSTSNHTSLQPGFYLFIGFVVFSWILSAIFTRIKKTAPSNSVC